MTTHRGIGQTELMLTNLPNEKCIIVVPSAEIGMAIDKRLRGNPIAGSALRLRGTWRTVVVRHLGDHEKLAGMDSPVFFDHSFFDVVDELVAMEALAAAIICSQRAKWTRETAEPNTDPKTAKEQPLAA